MYLHLICLATFWQHKHIKTYAREGLSSCCKHAQMQTWHGVAQLEMDHTAVLHLRSRRFASDEAVYETIDLFSQLLCALRAQRQNRPGNDSSSRVPRGFHVPRDCLSGGDEAESRDVHRRSALARHIETAVAVLQGSDRERLVSRQSRGVHQSRTCRGCTRRNPRCLIPVVQGNVHGEDVMQYLERASAGAARVIARKVLDTVVREAAAWELELQKATAQGRVNS